MSNLVWGKELWEDEMSFDKKGNTTVCKEVAPLIQNTPKKAPNSGVGYKQESANQSGKK